MDSARDRRSQQGCLPGCQTITSLYLAHSLLYKEYKLQTPSLWLLLDIQQAFDSLRRSKLLNVPACMARLPFQGKQASCLTLIKARLTMRWSGTAMGSGMQYGYSARGSALCGTLRAYLGGVPRLPLPGLGSMKVKFRRFMWTLQEDPSMDGPFADDCILCFQGLGLV